MTVRVWMTKVGIAGSHRVSQRAFEDYYSLRGWVLDADQIEDEAQVYPFEIQGQPEDGEIPVYDEASGRFKPGTAPGGGDTSGLVDRPGNGLDGKPLLWNETSDQLEDATPAIEGIVDARGIGTFELGAAEVRYVAPGGKDSNSGLTRSSPLLSVAAAYASLPATGGVIELSAGLHTSTATTEITNSIANRNKPVTIRGAGMRRTIWRRSADFVLFRMAGVLGTAGNGAEFVSDITVADLTFDGRGFDAGGPGYSSNLIEILECNHLEFHSVRFYNVRGSGVFGRVVENTKFKNCRFSALGSTSGGNVAGTEMINGTNLETNGVRWESCDFEITYSGRDLHIVGDGTRSAQNLVIDNCKFESAPISTGAYAPSQRALFERCDDILVVNSKFIRGLNTQLDFSLCSKARVLGTHFHDGQGSYLVHFQDGQQHLIDDCQFQGSAAMSTAAGAHLRIGASANVKIGILRHQVVGTEKRIDDQSNTGRRTMLTADLIGLPMPFQKATVAASTVANMGAIQGSTVEYVVPRTGRLVALTAYSSAAITTGSITFTAQKNGGNTALSGVLDNANKSLAVDLGYAAGVVVVAGDLIRVTVTPSADIAPTSVNLNAVVYLAPDPVS